MNRLAKFAVHRPQPEKSAVREEFNPDEFLARLGLLLLSLDRRSDQSATRSAAREGEDATWSDDDYRYIEWGLPYRVVGAIDISIHECKLFIRMEL